MSKADVHTDAAAGEVDRIRDIIFGSNMREYDERFGAVQSELAQLRQEIAALRAQLTSQDAGQDQKLAGLSKTTQEAHEALHQAMVQANQGLADELSQARQSLHDAMCSADDALREELRQTAHKLGHDKTDRGLLGDLLVRLGTQLKTDGAEDSQD